MLFAGIHFLPRVPQKSKTVFVAVGENEKADRRRTQNVQMPIRFHEKRTILFMFQMKSSFLKIVTGLIEDAEGKKE